MTAVPRLRFLGATGTVTGSKFRLETADRVNRYGCTRHHPAPGADHVVVDSTYGNRRRDRSDSEQVKTHGEPDASDALRLRISERLGWPVTVPENDQTVELR